MDKRVLIFSTAYLPLIGGAEVAVKEVTNRITDMQFDMVTARLRRSLPKQEKIGNVQIYRVGFGIPFFDKLLLAFFGYRKAMQLHRKHAYDLAWSIMASYGGFATLSFKRKTGVPFLLTLQEGDPIPKILEKARFMPKKFRKIFTKADGVQAISTYLMDWGKDMSFAGSSSAVIPNGVDIAQFRPGKDAPEHRAQIRKQFGIPTDAPVIITVSRLVVKNGVKDLISAMEYLPQEYHLLIVGTGELEEVLRQHAQSLSASEHIHFVGEVTHAQVPPYLWASDVFCRPSHSEGLGNVFLEAIAAHLPIVGTTVGGIADFLKDNETGFVCKVGDPQSVTQAITRAHTVPAEQQKEIHAAGMRLVRDRYNWDHISARMHALFDQLCHR